MHILYEISRSLKIKPKCTVVGHFRYVLDIYQAYIGHALYDP